MYFLLNKDKIVGKFIDTGKLSENFEFIEKEDLSLPIGIKDINDWIENRKASKHNATLRKIMEECGCSTKTGFIKVTHAASLNDTFWIKSDKENITWKDVSLYKNEFNETISKLAFEGVGLYGFQFEDTSPELSTEGSFRKCWKKEKNGIYLYKRGSEGARNAGLEPYCEYMTSKIAKKICKDSVEYQLVKLHGNLASKCQLFTDEQHGYVPMAKIDLKNKSLDSMLNYFAQIGSEDEFRRMLVFDAITFNVDRHLGNYGILINNDTLETIKMAPVFDLNMAMLPYIEREDFSNIGNKMLEYGPRIGDDFTRVGQLALTSEIRRDLINLKGFEFEFKGDDNFTKERVKFMEEMVNRQISAVLSKEKLYTKDVFIPEQKETEKIKNNNDKFVREENKLTEIANKLNINADCFINETENGNLELQIIPKTNPNITFCVSGTNGDLEILENDETLKYDLFVLKHNSLLNIYEQISKVIDEDVQIQPLIIQKDEIEP